MVGMVMVDGIMCSSRNADAKLEAIRNLITAGDLVRAEFEAAGR